jgi:hypothetical protein
MISCLLAILVGRACLVQDPVEADVERDDG